MSKIVLFYEQDEKIIGTVVSGNGFHLISHLVSSYDYQQVCEFVEQGMKNNGYHWNAVQNDYEFWSAGKPVNQGFDSLEQIEGFQCDGKFKVDAEKILIQVG